MISLIKIISLHIRAYVLHFTDFNYHHTNTSSVGTYLFYVNTVTLTLLHPEMAKIPIKTCCTLANFKKKNKQKFSFSIRY